VNEQFHLACILAVREDANVAAHRESHAGFARGLHALPLFLDSFRLGPVALMPSFVLRDRISCRDSRAKCHAVLFHELKNFRGAFVAVLDSFDTSQHSAADAADPRAAQRMLREVAKLVANKRHGLGYLEPAAYERTVDVLLSAASNPVIRQRPEGAWTHEIWERAYPR